MIEQYAQLQPDPEEEKYLEFDEDFDQWGLFGETSGFCYQLTSEKPDET